MCYWDFYHPNCVAKALQFKFGDKAKDLELEIAAGKPFMCPFHFCFRCVELEPEDTNDLQMQFTVYRCYPKAYHRKCLPRRVYDIRGSWKCTDDIDGPPCTGFVEGMAPVFSRDAWHCA